MPRVVRRRRIPAPAGAIWSVISDPYHLPRWWPGTSRVENVTSGEPTGRKWTQVLETKDGRGVRTDYRCTSAAQEERYLFEQLVEGTPYAKTLKGSSTEIYLDPQGPETEVTLARELKLRGLNRLGGFMFRRATGRILSEALNGLEGAVGTDRSLEGAAS
jgi:uncharacterized protein YndB with AHSA1/START domain